MTYSPDVFREILRRAKAADAGQEPVLSIEGHSSSEVNEHVALLIDGGLLTGSTPPRDEIETEMMPIWVEGPTMDGIAFLKKLEDERTRNRFKVGLAKLRGTVAPAAFKALIKRIMRDG